MQTIIPNYDQRNRFTRSFKDIEVEISLLHKLCRQIPARTMFGNSNETAVAAQIEVLRCQLNREEVCERYRNDDVDQYVFVCAVFAWEWLCEGELAPSEDWLMMLYPEYGSRHVN